MYLSFAGLPVAAVTAPVSDGLTAAPRLARLLIIAMPAAAVVLSKDLKKRERKLVGPTTVAAFMQAMGLVNDHAPGCIGAAKAAHARAAFRPPR
jgi:3-methyladenine DNA glycosylase Tag